MPEPPPKLTTVHSAVRFFHGTDSVTYYSETVFPKGDVLVNGLYRFEESGIVVGKVLECARPDLIMAHAWSTGALDAVPR